MVTVKTPNTKVQDDFEHDYDLQELKRIKAKYKLKDTMVVIPGEYDTIASLTKNGKLFGYVYDKYLFRIDVYREHALIDTRYVQIYISYGC